MAKIVKSNDASLELPMPLWTQIEATPKIIQYLIQCFTRTVLYLIQRYLPDIVQIPNTCYT